MFQASAFQVNAYQIGIIPGVVTPVVVDDARSKGGWDPYWYKPRRKSAKKRDEVERFLTETAQIDAPEAVQETVDLARDAAQEYLALVDKAERQREAQRLLSEALDRIDAFYDAVRLEAERRRAQDEEDDEDWLLLN